MKNLVLLLPLLANIICFSQSVSIYDIETSSFPIIKAKFNVFDKDGNIVRPNKSELKLSENGIKREIVTTNCPDVTPPKTVSIAMSIDISGSMGYSNFGDLPVELGKKTATELCKLIAMPPSQFALQTCHGTAFILNDFTTNKNKILDLITPIRAGGDNNFVEHLLNERTGILNIAKLGKNKRIAIVYTDAWWYQLSKSELERCINICKEYDIEFYAVIYSRPEAEPNGIKASLQALCNASGGYMYDGITSEEAALELSRRIQKEVQLVEPCTIEWKSGPACVSNDIKVDLEWNKTVGSTSYKSGSNSIPTLQYSSKFLAFGKVLPNQKSTKTIKITAKNADCNILNIVSDEPSFTAINTTFPILIAENQTKEFTIQYAPLDSNLKYVTIDVINDNCPSSFSANGGFPGKFGTKKLKVTHPNGGEQFVVGSDTNITWTGIGRNDEVSIELSRDEGKTWKEINNLATGLKADWKNIEKPVGNKCLIKVKQNAQDGGSDTSANTVVSLENGTEWVYSIAWSDLGDKIVSTSNDNKVRVWNVKEKRILATLDKHTSEVKAVAYSSDGSKFATGSSEAIAVWDAQNYQLVQFIPAQNITGLAWDNTSSQVCGVSETDFIKIWEVSTGKELQKLQWSSLAKYYSVDWSSDNQQIACGNADGNITLFSPTTGKIIKTLTGHDEQINSVCWSPEGDKLVSGSDDFSVKIWDVAKGSAIKTITDFDGFVYGVDWSPTGEFIATGSGDDTVKVWNAENGTLVQKFVGHDGRVFDVEWSPDSRKLASSSIDGSIKIWNISSKEVVLEDVSDAVFSIVKGEAKAKDIDMGEQYIGFPKDLSVSDFVTNIGTYPVKIDSIYFTGADANAFSLVSGFPKYLVNINEKKQAEFRFIPNKQGNHQASINVLSAGDLLTYNIKGIGVRNSIEVTNALIDFGKINVGDSKDTFAVATIKNIGSSNIIIKKLENIGPNKSDFEIFNSNSEITLKPNEVLKVDGKFSPSSRGRTSSAVSVQYDGAITKPIIQLFGEGIPADSNCYGRSFNYSKFSFNSSLERAGNATLTKDSTIIMTEAKANSIGGVNYSQRVSVQNNFTMNFSFRMYKGYNSFEDGSLPGADGVAVLFQNGKNFRITDKGGSLGYNGILNCVALEVDTYKNAFEYDDPNGNHVALQVPFNDTITAKHEANRTKAINDKIFTLRTDSTIYYGRIIYDSFNKKFEFYLDTNKSVNNLVLTANDFDFSRYLKLEKGDFAFIGITSTTGSSAEVHELLSWEFCSDRDEVLSIENDLLPNENDNLGILQSIRIYDYLGKEILNDSNPKSEFNINDYQLKSGIYIIILEDTALKTKSMKVMVK